MSASRKKLKLNHFLLITQRRPPLVIMAGLRIVAHRLFRFTAPPYTVDWKDTISTVIAGLLAGLAVGVGLCVILIPIMFWPGRFSHSSLYDRLGHPHWIAWVFVITAMGATLLGGAVSRISVRNPVATGESLDVTDLDSHV